MLLDANANIGALQKGRSSSRKPGRLLQKAGAYTLACDFAPRFPYVPTEDMPADAPSRGVRARPTRRRVLTKRGYSKPERRLHKVVKRQKAQLRFLEQHDRERLGCCDSLSGGFCASSSSTD